MSENEKNRGNGADRSGAAPKRPAAAGNGKRTGGKPAAKTYGKPAGKNAGKNASGAAKRFGKPAAPGAKPFGKPAPGARKPSGRPAPGTGSAPEKPAAFDGAASGKPASGEGRTFRKPAPGTGKTFGKPAAGGKRIFGKPAPGGEKPFRKAEPAGGAVRRGAPAGRPASGTKPAEPEGLASRRAALKVLRAVTEEGAYASLTLDRVLQGSGLNAADRRLVSRLVYDTLDRLVWLDHMLSQVMAREDTDIRLKNILRLGACQILLEDRIPESAATNTCVLLCAENGMEALKGVCNGILRNLVRKKDELTLPDPETEPERAFAVRNSLPLWLGNRLREEWGAEEAEKIAAYREPDGAMIIRRNLLKTDEAAFEEILNRKVWKKEPADLPDARRISGAMDIARDADFLAGAFSIQSEPSMMACLAMGVRRGMQVLDCCAAPGGKTCYLSELMGDTGRVQAWDVHGHRVELIAAQQRRLGLENIRPIMRDAAKYREDLDTRMDAVLLDAPCSGLGVISEKPDIKLRVTEESTEELIRLQEKLLDTVCRYVKPGGVLVYSTCSVLKAENELQIRAFLDRHPEFEAEKLPASVPEKFRQYEGLGLQLLPHRDGTEGFYICRMRRKETEE